MPKDTSITPHERGWAVLFRGVMKHVYPSRYLALQAAKSLGTNPAAPDARMDRTDAGHNARSLKITG